VLDRLIVCCCVQPGQGGHLVPGARCSLHSQIARAAVDGQSTMKRGARHLRARF